MTHPNKRKGNAAELAVAKALRELGWTNAERSRSGWTDDRGDIDGVPGWTIEVKNERRIDLPRYLSELHTEMANADCDHGFVVVKRRGIADAQKWYAVTDVETMVRLAQEAGW